MIFNITCSMNIISNSYTHLTHFWLNYRHSTYKNNLCQLYFNSCNIACNILLLQWTGYWHWWCLLSPPGQCWPVSNQLHAQPVTTHRHRPTAWGAALPVPDPRGQAHAGCAGRGHHYNREWVRLFHTTTHIHTHKYTHKWSTSVSIRNREKNVMYCIEFCMIAIITLCFSLFIFECLSGRDPSVTLQANPSKVQTSQRLKGGLWQVWYSWVYSCHMIISMIQWIVCL